MTRFREYKALKDELSSAKTQLADRKVIEKAKGFLMKQKGMDEDAAFKALRKMAMDKGKSLAEVASSVMAVAELLG
jgi:response regulator NasT